jgi:hypothetical protein
MNQVMNLAELASFPSTITVPMRHGDPQQLASVLDVMTWPSRHDHVSLYDMFHWTPYPLLYAYTAETVITPYTSLHSSASDYSIRPPFPSVPVMLAHDHRLHPYLHHISRTTSTRATKLLRDWDKNSDYKESINTVQDWLASTEL